MEFDKLLIKYMEDLGVSQKRFAEICGISPSTLCRYLNGQRSPSKSSPVFKAISDGVSTIYAEKGIDVSSEELSAEMNASVKNKDITSDILTDNVNIFIEYFDIKSSDLADYLHYTHSHFSNIRMKRRSIKDPEEAVGKVVDYIISVCKDGENRQKLIRLTHNSKYPAAAVERLLRMDNISLEKFIFDITADTENPTFENFIWNAEIEVHDYARLDDIIQTRIFIGKSSISDARLLFFSSGRTLIKGDHLFIYDYDHYPSIREKEEWKRLKNIQLSLNTILRKGVIIDKICRMPRNVACWKRFFEFWLPLFFCGEVNFHWLDNTGFSLFQEILLLHKHGLLVGTCAPEEPSLGRVSLTKNRGEVSYYRREVDYILKISRPMFEIEESRNNYDETVYMFHDCMPDKYVGIVDSNVIVAGASESLRKRIWERLSIPENIAHEILKTGRKIQECLDLLNENHQAVFYIMREENTAEDIPLPLYTNEFGGDGYFTEDEYKEMLEGFEAYVAKRPNLSIQYIAPKKFKHLRFIFTDKWTLVTQDTVKSKQMIIREKVLTDAIQKIVL